MRLISGGLAALAGGCGLSDYLPRGPSLSPAAGARWLDQGLEPVHYTGPARAPLPLPPFQVFSLHYVDDIVIETTSPRWSMHEYARVEVGDRELWIAKDSDRDGLQTVTADLDDIASWLPEIPVPRVSGPVEVSDRSSGDRVDITVRYRTPAGEDAEVHFAADRSSRLEKKRSGSTFNHSQQAAAVVLDIPHRQLSGVDASVRYDGEPARIRRLLGLVPVAALLDQTQAGFAIASMQLSPRDGGYAVRRPIPGEVWNTRSEELWTWEGEGDSGSLRYADRASAWGYTFVDGELSAIEAGPPEAPTLSIVLSAPLPDLRRPFEGEISRAFALNLGGEVRGHGWIRCRREGEVAVARLEPEAPRWFAERPLETRIWTTAEGDVLLRTRRVSGD